MGKPRGGKGRRSDHQHGASAQSGYSGGAAETSAASTTTHPQGRGGGAAHGRSSGSRGRGDGSAGRSSAGRGRGEAPGRPQELLLPSGDEVSTPDANAPRELWPITPLGLPRTPPPLPPLPGGLGGTAFFPPLEALAEPLPSYDTSIEALGSRAGGQGQAVNASPDGDWTPVAEQESKSDRRTFFHTEGKPLSFNPSAMYAGRAPVDASTRLAIGTDINLKVEEVHFGNPRVRILQGEPAPMPSMLKWPPKKFDEHVLECAQVDYGCDYRVWSVIGIRSNRLLYAMKRNGVVNLKAKVVPPPDIADDDADPTYGACVQGIQLVP